MGSRVYPHIADAILGYGDKKKSLQRRYMTISDDDLVRAIDMIRFEVGEAGAVGEEVRFAVGTEGALPSIN